MSVCQMRTYFNGPLRPNGHYKGRPFSLNGNILPQYSNSSVVQEKLGRGHRYPWLIPVDVPIPGIKGPALRIWVPNPRRLHHFSIARFGRKRGSILLCFAFMAVIFTTFALAKRFGTEEKKWPGPFTTGDPPTLVFRREDIQRIWQWEVASGHYPSRHSSKCFISMKQTF